MVRDAPISSVLQKDYKTEMKKAVSANEWITIYFDGEFPLEPDIEVLELPTGKTLAAIQKFKGRIRLKLGQSLAIGDEVRLKIKPRRLI